MNALTSIFGDGLEPGKLTVLQVALRAVVIFFSTLVIVRYADKRFFAKKTAFDLILALILASMMARAINGGERLVPTIVAGFLLASLHRLLALLACRWPGMGGLIKGHDQVLIRDGKIDFEQLRQHHLEMKDLEELLRLKGVENPDEVHLARLERSGEVSVIRK